MKKLLTFTKEDLVNLENSLHREILSTNRAGGYMSTSIIGCNTRKYHGLLVCPIDEIDGEDYVLLSSLDQSIVHNGKTFNFSTHRYPGVYSPKGYKYIEEFLFEPTPTWRYKIGGVVLKVELIMVHESPQMMLCYTLEKAPGNIDLRLRPFLSFRCRHKLSKANLYINTMYQNTDNGISARLYNSFPDLHMQLNRKNNFISDAHWYYNVEYLEEKRRGYPFQEDLFSHGYFEVNMKEGDSIVFSASLKEESSSGLLRTFKNQLSKRDPKSTYLDLMKNAANQFIAERDHGTEIIAGFPWFGRWGRDTFIALPGLTLADNYRPEVCKSVLDTMTREIKNGLFPNIGKAEDAAYNSVDAPMWYFWAIQKYAEATGKYDEVWKSYGRKMKDLLNKFKTGINEHIKIHDNGLIWAKQDHTALTWMDAVVFGEPVTQRGGYTVEVNALWYNAIKFTLELAHKYKDNKFIAEWEKMPSLIKDSFLSKFWNQELGYLADYVDDSNQNMFLRSNQVIATSLPYVMLDNKQIKLVLKTVEKELLTPKGLRTLSPKNTQYKDICEGDQPTRDKAYHQGTVWVWQLGHFVEANFKIYGSAYSKKAEEMIHNFEQDVAEYGVGGIAEIYDGNPPHHARGSISQAWSVSEILRITKMIEENKSAAN